MYEQEPTIILLTEEQISEQAFSIEDHVPLSESAPDVFNSATTRFLGIFNQLSGQAKADFFHMRHFPDGDDQQIFWKTLATADDDAAEWRANFMEVRENQHQQYLAEKGDRESLYAAIFDQAAAKVTLGRPYAVEADSLRTTSQLTGNLKGSQIDFWLGYGKLYNSETENSVIIDIPQAPTPLDIDSSTLTRYAKRRMYALSRYGSSQSTDDSDDYPLVTTGTSIVIQDNIFAFSSRVIDRSNQPTAGWEAFQTARNNLGVARDSLPAELSWSDIDSKYDDADRGKLWGQEQLGGELADLTLQDVFDLIKNAEPIKKVL